MFDYMEPQECGQASPEDYVHQCCSKANGRQGPHTTMEVTHFQIVPSWWANPQLYHFAKAS